jgi:PmbA protein
MNEQIQAYVDLAVDYGQKLNVDLIIARGFACIDNQIRFSQNKIDISKEWHSNLLELLIVMEKNHVVIGEVSPTSDDQLRDRIKAMLDFAKKVTPSPFYQGAEEKIGKYPSLEGLYDSNIKNYKEKAPQSINSCIHAAIAAGATRVAGSFIFGEKNVFLKSSFSPSGSYSGTYYNLTVRAFQEELDASGQGLSSSRIHNEKEIISAGERAGYFSKLHKGAKQAKAGVYDVIMSPTVAANLMGSIPKAANPLDIMMGLSPLEDKMGEKLAPDFVTVIDDGLISEGLNSAPFDFEGTPHQSTSIIKNGILVNYLHNTSTAKKYGTNTTGNSELVDIGIGTKLVGPAPTNLVFNNGDHSFEELLETSSPNTIMVTCNWYTRYTSPISTEFSTIPRDAAFLVKNGELKTPLKNFRISDNMLRQFVNINAMGNDRTQVQWWEVEKPIWIPTIRVKDCHITTATK